MAFGCVIFDEDKPTSGWASIQGEPAFRINSVHDLRSDILWWTSLSYQAFNLSAIYLMPHMRCNDYLRTSMGALRDELGLSSKNVPMPLVTESLAELFSKVMFLAQQYYGLSSSRGKKLCEDLRPLIMGPDLPLGPLVDRASELATQQMTKAITQGRVKGKTKSLQLKLSRVQHGLHILNNLFPGPKFQVIESHKLPPSSDAKLNYVLSSKRPALVELGVSHVDPTIADILAYGSGSTQLRSWVSSPELLLLAKYAEVDVKSVIFFDPVDRLPVKIGPPMPNMPFGELSMAVGLLMENYWIALANPYEAAGRRDRIYSPRAAWMRALDRLWCFNAARSLHHHGLSVGMYGVGSVSVDMTYGTYAENLPLIKETGLLPPVAIPDELRGV